MQILRPYPRHTKSDSLGVRPSNLCNHDLQVILMKARVWEALAEIVIGKFSERINGGHSSNMAAE